MNKEKIKEKIFSILYPTSILVAFVCTVDNISKLLKQHFPYYDIEMYYFICCLLGGALIVFFRNFFDNQTHQLQEKHIEEIYYIALIHKFDYDCLSIIYYFKLDNSSTIQIVLKNNINIYLDIKDAININNQQKLEELDCLIKSNSEKIIQQVKEKYNISSDSKLYNSYMSDEYKTLVKSYIRTLKDKK